MPQVKGKRKCWSYKILGTAGKETAKKVRHIIIRGLEGRAARQAVISFSQTLEDTRPLRCHLEDRRYGTSMSKPPAKFKLPISFVSRPNGASGTPGNQTRKRQKRYGDYTQSSDEHKRLHRGKKS